MQDPLERFLSLAQSIDGQSKGGLPDMGLHTESAEFLALRAETSIESLRRLGESPCDQASREDEEAYVCAISHPNTGSGLLPLDAFQLRFKDELRRRGVPVEHARLISASFKEMTDNAILHARDPLPPIATWQAKDDWWSYSVTDTGQGILASLRSNATYKNLVGDLNALKTALRDGVTSTKEPGRGRGFTWVFRALADRRCVLRFVSGRASIAWLGCSPTDHALEGTIARRHTTGFHVAVVGRV